MYTSTTHAGLVRFTDSQTQKHIIHALRFADFQMWIENKPDDELTESSLRSTLFLCLGSSIHSTIKKQNKNETKKTLYFSI